jgi:putative transposase
MKLSDRTYICPKCGLTIDRDLNAAINIRNIGLQNTFGLKGINACGDDVSQTSAEPKTMQSSVKQEKRLNQ